MLFYSRVLPHETYGQYQNIWIRLALMGTFAYAGLPAFFLSFSAAELKGFYRYGSPKLKAGLVAWALFWGGGYAWLQWYQGAIPFYMSLPLLLLYAINALQESLIIVAERSQHIVRATLLYTVGYLFLHYRACSSGQGTLQLSFLLAGLVLLGLLRALYYALVVRDAYRDVAVVPSGGLSQEARHYWGHSGLYDLLQTVFRWADKFIVALLLPGAVSAIYFNGAQDIPFVSLLLGAFSSTALVKIATARDQDTNALGLMRYTGRLLSCVMLPLFFFLLLYRHELYELAFGGRYAGSVPVFAVTLLLLPLRSYGFGTLLQSRRMGKVINTGALLDLAIAFGLMYPLYRWLGLPGIALSFVLSTVLQSLYYLWQTGKAYHATVAQMLPLANWGIKLIVFGVLFIGTYYATHDVFDPYIRLSLGAGLLLLSIAAAFINEIKHPAAPDGKNTPANEVQ